MLETDFNDIAVQGIYIGVVCLCQCGDSISLSDQLANESCCALTIVLAIAREQRVLEFAFGYDRERLNILTTSQIMHRTAFRLRPNWSEASLADNARSSPTVNSSLDHRRATRLDNNCFIHAGV